MGNREEIRSSEMDLKPSIIDIKSKSETLKL
jgi:hypothetical protein